MIEILTALGSVVAALAAVGAWRSAAHSGRASETLTAIERHRWHTDLTPRFSVRACPAAGARIALRVVLEGPPGLDRLDQLTVTLRDDHLDRTPIIAGGPSLEQIARQVWGPYRFVTSVDGADETGRSIAPVMMQLGDGRPFSLEPTTPPPWGGDGASWDRQYKGSPIRLTFSCYREGHEQWTVPVEVNIDPV